jgi:hypothetical protein
MKRISRLGYATHVPVLIEMARNFRIETVVEIGSGPVSTRLFLDKSIFKDLKSLLSFEHYKSWHKEVRKLVGKDNRFNYILTDKSLDYYNIIEGGDMLFLDGLKHHRVYGLTTLGRNFRFTVLHDSDMQRVVEEVEFDKYYKYMVTYTPPSLPRGQGEPNPTAILSNTENVEDVEWEFNWKKSKRLIKKLSYD